MNRIHEKRKPWWTPIPIRNEFDFQPAMGNKLSLKLPRDRLAHSTGPNNPYSQDNTRETVISFLQVPKHMKSD